MPIAEGKETYVWPPEIQRDSLDIFKWGLYGVLSVDQIVMCVLNHVPKSHTQTNR